MGQSARCDEDGGQSDPSETFDPIAIIGLASRLPGAGNSSEKLWSMIQEGRRACSSMPKDRVNIEAFYHPSSDRVTTTNVRHANWLGGDVAAFDAPFFSIQPFEAQSMDPQQRMLLETSYQALENAGIPMETLVGSKTSVYIASTAHDYEIMQFRDPEMMPKYMSTGTAMSLLSNRVSWFFDFRGPSVSLDTACSGSLTAVHMACSSLRNRESEMALVGGVSINLVPEVIFSQLSTLGFLSPDGCSHSFDARANGYGKGEGLGIVVLKRVADAVRDGDMIRAVIRSTSVNQDGRTPGITQPSKRAQTENIHQAYRLAGLDPKDTTFFEAHGTGTAVGDPFEAEAIHSAFQRTQENPLYIGAFKANIGHLEAGAGIAATIKAVHVLEKGVIPPIAGFEKRNPAIPEEWNLKFPNEPVPFPEGVRRMSINSFGYGGTNAHIILDDGSSFVNTHAPGGKHCTLITPTKSVTNGTVGKNGHYRNGHDALQSSRAPAVLIFSAADELGVKRLAESCEQYLSKLPFLGLHDQRQLLINLTYTLSNKRSSLPWKAFSIITTNSAGSNLSVSLSKPCRSSQAPRISYIFTGQGAQWHAMARGLFAYPIVYKSMQKSKQYLWTYGCPWDLIDELHKDEDMSRVDEPELSQPLCTALQIAVVDLLSSWGFEPAAVCGHSSGEIAAAYCAGALSHESAMCVAWHRGRIAASIAANQPGRGAMLAVALTEVDVAPYVQDAMKATGGYVSVGCVNAPANLTITGDTVTIAELQDKMDSLGIFSRRLQVAVAYHSNHLAEHAADYLASLEGIVGSKSTGTLMFSSVTGEMTSRKESSSPSYWVRNLVGQVRYADSLTRMKEFLSQNKSLEQEHGTNIVIEIGPHPALQRPTKDIFDSEPHAKQLVYDSLLSRGSDPLHSIAQAMGRLRCQGYPIDLTGVSYIATENNNFLPELLTDLPPYTFNHTQTYWSESRMSKGLRLRSKARHELLGVREIDWNALQPKWRNVIRRYEHPWMVEYKLHETIQYPVAGLMVMVIEAMRQLSSNEPASYHLSDVQFYDAFRYPIESETVEAQLQFIPRAGSYAFQIFAYVEEGWTNICDGTVTTDQQIDAKARLDSLGLQRLHDSTFMQRWEKMQASQFYSNMKACGYGWPQSFRNLHDLHFTSEGLATATFSPGAWHIKLEDIPKLSDHVIHPMDLDAIFQVSAAALSQCGSTTAPCASAAHISSLWIAGKPEQSSHEEIRVLADTTYRAFRETVFNIGAVNNDGEIKAIVEGLRCRPVEVSVTWQAPIRSSYRVEWRPDIDLLPTEALEAFCLEECDLSVSLSADAINRQEMVCLYFLGQALEVLSSKALPTDRSHLNRYVEWAKEIYDPGQLSRIRDSSPLNQKFFNQTTRLEFLEIFTKETCEGRLILYIGEHLVQILTGHANALQLLYGDCDIASDYFLDLEPRFSRLMPYVDLLGFKHSDLSILEVGAGTGSMSQGILSSLTKYNVRQDNDSDIPRLTRYTFTDISTSFFEDAKVRLKEYERFVEYTPLDLEADPVDQGFITGSYDLIVANMVLYATSNITKTLGHIRKLLKPGGKLILYECFSPTSCRSGFVFGLLPGWWLAQEHDRQFSPLLRQSDWQQRLIDNGFSGIDLHLSDCEDPSISANGLIFTTAIDHLKKFEEAVEIISTKEQEPAKQLYEMLTPDFDVTIQNYEDCFSHDFSGSHCIVLVEMVTDFFAEMNEADWRLFQKILTDSKSILWVTIGSGAPCTHPTRSLVQGLGRAIRSEDQDSRFTELALTPQADASSIARVFRQSLQPYEGLLESEFMDNGSHLCIGRLSEAEDINNRLHEALGHRQSVSKSFESGKDTGLQLTIATPSYLETLSFDDDSSHALSLGPFEVEIEVKATCIRKHDVNVALGLADDNVFGDDCAGIVVRAGKDSSFRCGDRVCAMTCSGSFKSFVRTDSAAVAHMPAHLEFTQVAGLASAYISAYYGLITCANLQPGESILITDGMTPLGQAATYIAQQIGAKIFVATQASQISQLRALWEIPDIQILESERDWTETIRNETQFGIDVALHGSRKETIALSLLSPFGRDIEFGTTSAVDRRLQNGVQPNVSLHLVNMRSILEKGVSKLGQAIIAFTKHLNSVDFWYPKPRNHFTVSELVEAFQSSSRTPEIGINVVEMVPTDQVLILPSRQPSYMFRHDATYVIAGGLGGLGGAMVEWMVSRNARHFLLLSRSGGEGSETARTFIAKVKSQGVTIIAPCCDISNADQVKAALTICNNILPPIKGCVQGAMVLREMLLSSMLAEDVHSVLRPKTLGTLNLDRFLPADLDFFVLLSSISSIAGFRGIGNYAMANTFLDAFARSRAARGLPCISLDLGAVKSIGVMADRGMTEWLLKEGLESLSTAEVFALLDWACDPTNPAARDPSQVQLVTGLAGVDTMKADHFQAVYWATKPMLRPLIQRNISVQGSRQASQDQVQDNWPKQMASAASSTDAKDVALAALTDRLARLLAVPVTDVEPTKSIQAFGIDSLITMELRQWVKKTLQADVSVSEMTSCESIGQIAGMIAEASTLGQSGQTQVE